MYTVGKAEVDGMHIGDELTLPDACGTSLERRIWWSLALQAAGGGRGTLGKGVGHAAGLKGGLRSRDLDVRDHGATARARSGFASRDGGRRRREDARLTSGAKEKNERRDCARRWLAGPLRKRRDGLRGCCGEGMGLGGGGRGGPGHYCAANSFSFPFFFRQKMKRKLQA